MNVFLRSPAQTHTRSRTHTHAQTCTHKNEQNTCTQFCTCDGRGSAAMRFRTDKSHFAFFPKENHPPQPCALPQRASSSWTPARMVLHHSPNNKFYPPSCVYARQNRRRKRRCHNEQSELVKLDRLQNSFLLIYQRSNIAYRYKHVYWFMTVPWGLRWFHPSGFKCCFFSSCSNENWRTKTVPWMCFTPSRHNRQKK